MILPLQERLASAITDHWDVDPGLGVVHSRRYNRTLTGKVDKDGYLVYGLPSGNRSSGGTVPAHFVVWWATEGQLPPSGMTINHKNGIKLDNRRVNLECVTGAENTSHAAAFGLRGTGKPHLTPGQVAEVRAALTDGQNVSAVSRQFDISRKTVRDIRDAKTWQNRRTA